MRRWTRRAAATLARAMAKAPSRRQLLRAAALVVALVASLAGPFAFYYLYVQSVEMRFFQLHMVAGSAGAGGGSNLSASGGGSGACALPDYDPFDERTRHFLYEWPAVKCGDTQPYLTFVDQWGYIRINWTAADLAGLHKDDFECMHAEILRRPGTDDEVDYGMEHGFQDSSRLHAPYVRARCVLRDGGRLLYETCHAQVTPLPPELKRRLLDSNPVRPSVLIVGIDSMSRLNTIRQLPLTYRLVTDTFKATVFKGMTKVGDNTYPNMLTMLTGMAARKKEGIKGRYWGEDKAYSFFDDLPLVWKNFSEMGYVTMYAEDLPEYTAFNYMAKGFRHDPTDYYMRRFWLAMDAGRNFRSSDDRCYGNVPQYEFLFNYTRDFVVKMADYRHFAFAFITSYSHNHINSVKVIDRPLHDLLLGLQRSGALKNTVLVVMGDHGNRFDYIRTTVVGRVEERMPFLSIALPAALRAARPHLEKGLRSNRETLVSWYDVYETLADIALDNLGPKPRVQRYGDLGTSLFRKVPSRGCLEAGVPREFCTCAHERQLATDDPAVLEAARDLVAHVNLLLSALARPEGACATLKLSGVLNAQLMLPNVQLARPQGFVALFRVAVQVEPSEALLEGTLERDAWDETSRVVGEVARINKYGNQSHCIGDKILKLYCYCTDLVPGAEVRL